MSGEGDNPRWEIIYPNKIWSKKERERERLGGKAEDRYIPAGRASGQVYMNETASIGNPED